MSWQRSALVLLLACGGSSPSPQKPDATRWRSDPNEHADRTIDQWTPADEDKYIAAVCQNVVDTDGAFRCPVLTRAGLAADHCVDSFNSMRASVHSDKEVEAFRLLVAGLWIASSCSDVDVSFRIAGRVIQHGDK